jgi:hypothetical protein
MSRRQQLVTRRHVDLCRQASALCRNTLCRNTLCRNTLCRITLCRNAGAVTHRAG